MDATLVTATRQPLIFTTPSSSFSQSRLEKGRLSAIPPRPSSASSAMNTSPSKPRLAQPFTAPPFAATPRAGAGFPFFAGVGTPTSPSTSSIFAVPLSSSPPADERMRDPSECETPPMSRTIPSSNLRGALSVETSSPTTGLMSKKGKNKGLQSPTLPLTPPLTPPYQEHHALLPAVELPSSPSPAPAPVPPPKPTTVSGRALLNHRLHPLFASSYSLCEELGSGGFGFVVRAERSIDQFSVAVKFIERAKIPSHGWVKSRSWGETPGLIQPPGPKLIPMEAFVLRSIRHEGVVAFIDLFEDDKYFYLIMEHHGSPWQPAEKPPKESLSRSGPADLPALASSPMQPTLSSNLPRILNVSPTSSPILMASHHAQPPSPARLSPPRPASMERRSSCDLFECIEAHSRFDERTARYVFAQVVEIIYALGQMGIVIDAAYRVKLIDFGSAVIFDPREPPPKYTRFHGTTSFASAEILRGEKYQAPSSEVWSLGVLLSILVTGECPFADAEAAKAGRISRPKVRLAPEVEHLLRKCLEVDVASRITISEIRRHPWLAGVWAPRH